MRLKFTKFRKSLLYGVLLLLIGNITNAQCLTATYSQYPFSTVAITCTGSGQTLATDCWAGEYSTITVTNGVTYTFSSSIATDFLTIGNTTGTTAFTSGVTPVVWTSTVTGNVRFYTHANAACGNQNTNRSRIVTCTPPACLPPTAVSNNTVTNSGATIAWSGTGSFILEYGPVGHTPGTGAAAGSGGTVISGVTSPYVLNTLAQSTSYSVFIRNNCTATSSGFSANQLTSFTTLGPPPANDEICGAGELTMGTICTSINGTTANATQSATTPNPSCGAGANGWDDDVWYTFTTGATQTTINMDFTSTLGTSDLVAEIYSASDGTCTGPLTSVACSDDNNGSLPGFSLTTVTPSTTYFVRVFSYSSTFGTTKNSNFTICVYTPPPPPSCAALIAPANTAVNVDIYPVEPTFSWSAVTGATSYDFYLGTTAATVTNIGNVATTSTPIFGLDFNETYFWYVVPVGSGGAAVGCDINMFSFTTELPPPPPVNDECANAIAINGASGVVSGTNLFATSSAVAGGLCANTTTANDVWYTVTADFAGDITIVQTVPSFEDLVLEVLTGDCLNPVETECVAESYLSAENSITFTAIANTTYFIRTYGWSGTDEGNFTIELTGTALPVKMDRLVGKIISGNLAQLSWNTLTEQNNKGFEIQRAIDGKHFNTVGFVGSKAIGGNSNEKIAYSFKDREKVTGSVYYRLQQTDIDGKTALSNVVRLSTKENGGFEVVAAPNPVKNSVAVKIYGAQASNATITVTDVTGKVMSTLTVTSNETIIDMNNFAQGIYLIKYTDAEHNETIKVSKQ